MKHWYEFIHRGLSPGCQPKGFVDQDADKGKFGHIAYDRKLTDKELSDYELRWIPHNKNFKIRKGENK